MNLDELERQLINDPETMSRFKEALAANVRNEGIDITKEELVSDIDDQNGLQEISLPDSAITFEKREALRAAGIKTLRDFGVIDHGDLITNNPGADIQSWNAVYKDGGWIINGREGMDL